MDSTLRSRAETYAAGQYETGSRNRCTYFGGDGAWHDEGHQHATAGEARECRDQRRAACVARIMANGGHSEL